MNFFQVTKAAMIGLEDGALRAWSPPSFIPEKQCIDDIIDAFNGDTAGLAERGINVGCGCYPSVPGKMDDDGIYGNDGHRGLFPSIVKNPFKYPHQTLC